MAKKINFLSVSEVDRAHGALLDFHVEHVVVSYPDNKYIVVLNRNLEDAKTAIEGAKLSPRRISNQRHYERIAAVHKHYTK